MKRQLNLMESGLLNAPDKVLTMTENRINMAGAQGVWRSFPVMS